MLREILGCLPTAEHGEDLPETDAKSPFMRNKKTHLARFVVINDVVYNGRVPVDAILSKLGVGDPDRGGVVLMYGGGRVGCLAGCFENSHEKICHGRTVADRPTFVDSIPEERLPVLSAGREAHNSARGEAAQQC